METYYQRNKQKILDRQNKYYNEHRTDRLEYARKYNIEHLDKVLKLREKRKEKIREYQGKYFKKWYKKNYQQRFDNYKERVLEWKQENPEKVKIQSKLNSEIIKGNIVRPDNCSICNKKTRIQAHHYNYDNYLNFIWVCSACHTNEHVKIKNTKNACKLDKKGA